MKLPTRSAEKKLYTTILLTMLGTLMYVSQVILSQLPNIEIVSLLIILTARKFGYKSLLAVYVFVGLEVLTYGISLWVVNYLYVWAILCLTVCLLRSIDSLPLYTVLSAVYGLSFGLLCSVPYFFIGGIGYAISYFVNGISFDLLHCFGNFITALLLYRPLTKVFDRLFKPHK